MKKVVCHWVLHDLTEHQKEEGVRISKETHKLLNDGGYPIISKIVTGDETYIPFFNVPTCQESKKYGIGQRHQVGRTEDSNNKLHADWYQVVFSDELRFKFWDYNGRIRVRRYADEPCLPECDIERYSGLTPGVMVCGEISYHG
ncbi:uncharacterized protein TNCV_4666361 [Trichonephila clavipes]|nr:uncharacterized protein TNCV_4666361 [Trichonephila clavipes]